MPVLSFASLLPFLPSSASTVARLSDYYDKVTTYTHPKTPPSLASHLIKLGLAEVATVVIEGVKYVSIGPAVENWDFRTTLVRSCLRTAMILNPPGGHHSVSIVRRFTNFAYPTHPLLYHFYPTLFSYHYGGLPTSVPDSTLPASLMSSSIDNSKVRNHSEQSDNPEIERFQLLQRNGATTDAMNRTHELSCEWVVCKNLAKKIEIIMKQKSHRTNTTGNENVNVTHITEKYSIVADDGLNFTDGYVSGNDSGLGSNNGEDSSIDLDSAFASPVEESFQFADSGLSSSLNDSMDTSVEGLKVGLFVHGGAFHFLSSRTHRSITTAISESCEIPVLALNQRLGPEHEFPASVEDMILAYLTLIGYRTTEVNTCNNPRLANLNILTSGRPRAVPFLRKKARFPKRSMFENGGDNATVDGNSIHVGEWLSKRIWKPEEVIFMGDSSGGSTALGAILALRDAGYPLPGGVYLLSPWLDLTCTNKSWTDNTCFLSPHLHGFQDQVTAYLSTHSQNHQSDETHPYISPNYASNEALSSLPPLFIQVGTHESLRDDSLVLAHRMGLLNHDNVKVVVQLWEGMFHVFQAFDFLEEKKEAMKSLKRWMDWLDKPENKQFEKRPEKTFKNEWEELNGNNQFIDAKRWVVGDHENVIMERLKLKPKKFR